MESEVYGHFFRAEDSHWWFRARRRVLATVMEGEFPKGGLTIADVGCGTGGMFALLSRFGEVTGVDEAPQAREYCSRRGPNRVLMLGEWERDQTRYDLITAFDVVEHVKDYLGFLRRLRPRGQLKLFHLPLEITVERLLRPNGFSSVRQRFGHLHHFTRQSALASLEDTGYRVIDWLYTPSELVLPPKSLGQRLARIPRRLVYMLHKGLAAKTTGGVSLMVLAE